MGKKKSRTRKFENCISKCFHTSLLCCFYILFAILNIIMLVCGLAITALSGYLYYSLATLRITGSNYEFPLPIATFIFGSLIVVLSIFGFACTGRPNCLMLYSACLISIMLLEILLAIHIYVNYAEEHASIRYQELFKEVFKDSLNRYSDDEESWKFVDMVQKNFRCCGIDSSEDWYSTPLRMVPNSCCVDDCTLYLDSVYPKGCPEVLQSDIKTKEERCYLLTTLTMPLGILYTALAIPINYYIF